MSDAEQDLPGSPDWARPSAIRILAAIPGVTEWQYPATLKMVSDALWEKSNRHLRRYGQILEDHGLIIFDRNHVHLTEEGARYARLLVGLEIPEGADTPVNKGEIFFNRSVMDIGFVEQWVPPTLPGHTPLKDVNGDPWNNKGGSWIMPYQEDDPQMLKNLLYIAEEFSKNKIKPLDHLGDNDMDLGGCVHPERKRTKGIKIVHMAAVTMFIDDPATGNPFRIVPPHCAVLSDEPDRTILSSAEEDLIDRIKQENLAVQIGFDDDDNPVSMTVDGTKIAKKTLETLALAGYFDENGIQYERLTSRPSPRSP
jgi:hypothetical protein